MKHQIRKIDRSRGYYPSIFNSYFNDNLFNNFFDGDMPATNVKETGKEFNIELSVPGFEKENINIEIDNNILKISAQNEVKNEEKDDNEKVLRQEFRKSSFTRSFTIPDNIDTESISAVQKDGVLQITLPKMDKAPEDKVKKIEIK